MTTAATDYDVIILGAGAAGLSAGLYTTRAMLKTLIIEQLGPGGQLLITDEIENYPGFPEGVKGQELAMWMEQQTSRFGAEIDYAEVQGVEKADEPVKVVHTDDRTLTAKSLIIATGGSHNKLGTPGEDEFAGRGVSYCAVCDGNFLPRPGRRGGRRRRRGHGRGPLPYRHSQLCYLHPPPRRAAGHQDPAGPGFR